MKLVGQVHIFGLKNIHTFGPNISLSRLFSLVLNYAKPRLSELGVLSCQVQSRKLWEESCNYITGGNVILLVCINQRHLRMQLVSDQTPVVHLSTC